MYLKEKRPTMADSCQKRYSSLRCVSAETTLAHAKQWAAAAGISRVTEIHSLDQLGLPVFASIRPRALSDSVTYGKGLLPIDAQVGAYMEAIEFKWAEPPIAPASNSVKTHWGKATEDLLHFCPLLQKKIDLDKSVLYAEAQDVETGQQARIPAELVFFPAPEVGQALFGSSTNGLASGNSVLEASLHALSELIERDIWSFEFLHDHSCRVAPETLPTNVQAIITRAHHLGLHVVVRHVPNDYDLPFFSAHLLDPQRPSNHYFNAGWGCHPHRDIALLRAVCEAAQSRAAVMHGARNFGPVSSLESLALTQRMTDPEQTSIAYATLPDLQSDEDLTQQWRVLVRCLRQVTKQPIYRVVFTAPDDPLQVVRLVVPGLENFKLSQKRVGYRFKAAIEKSGAA